MLIALMAVGVIVYFPLLNYGFIDWDDDIYTTNNPLFRGSVVEVIKNAFSSYHFGNYYPITLLSFYIDQWLFEHQASVLHLENLLLHLLNTLLISRVCNGWFKDKGMALFAAAVFLLHPMHLEVVAWISCRKDLLYVCFFLLSILQYQQSKQSFDKYFNLSLLFFILSLMSKSPAVMLSPILLLHELLFKPSSLKSGIQKVWPFFVLSLIFGLVAISSQSADHAIDTSASSSTLNNLVFSGHAIWTYLVKFFFPLKLSLVYPYPVDIVPQSHHWINAILIYGVSILMLILFRKRQRFVFGYLFFLIGVLPGSQIIPFGTSLVSERYSYLAYLGLTIASYDLLSYAKNRWLIKKGFIALILFLFVGFLSVQNRWNTNIWESSFNVWNNAIESTVNNQFAIYKRGSVYAKNNDWEKAKKDFEMVLQINPNNPYAMSNLGYLYLLQGEMQLSYQHLTNAYALDSNFYEANLNLGLWHFNQNELNEAKRYFNNCIQLNPSNPLAYYNLYLLFQKTGNVKESERYLKLAQKMTAI